MTRVFNKYYLHNLIGTDSVKVGTEFMECGVGYKITDISAFSDKVYCECKYPGELGTTPDEIVEPTPPTGESMDNLDTNSFLPPLPVNIMSTTYMAVKRKYDEIPDFKKRGIDAFCDDIKKEIVLCDLTTYPGYEDETKEYCYKAEVVALRHEIVHAFLNESGLTNSALHYDGPWAKNEEMVDWISIQLPKIYQAYRYLGIE
jgi:hypothetical protein